MKNREVTPGILKDGEEEKAVFDILRDSLETEVSRVDKTFTTTEDGLVSSYLAGSTVNAGDYFTSQWAAEAEDYIRDIVYGGVDGFAYVRSLAEFVGSGPMEVS
jgi:bromodomain-containing protein 7/9